jgi:hypothetical protein
METICSAEPVPILAFEEVHSEGARSDRLIADDLRYFLGHQRTALARNIAAWSWFDLETPSISLNQFKSVASRHQLIFHMLEAAPWDDHYIAYVQLPSMKRMRIEWFMGIGFCDNVDWIASAESFLNMCRRNGLYWPTARQDPERNRLERSRAMDYLSEWRWQIARRLMGRFIEDLL